MSTHYLLPLAALALLTGCDQAHGAKHAAETKAVAEAVTLLVPTAGNQVGGTLVMTQKEDAVEITGEVTGLTPGDHGFHVHMFGDLRAKDGASAGGHYNPGGHKHGGLEHAERHAGDLGNITADAQGVAKVAVKAQGLHLGDVVGRSVVVHANPDDFKSQPSGNSGPRVAVGVIGLAEVKAAGK